MERLDQYIYKRHTDQTAQSYLYNIDVFLMRNPSARTFLYSDIINYLNELKNKNPEIRLSPKLAGIKRYYDYLLETGQRNDHPCRTIRLKQKAKAIQLQDLFSSKELEALMNRENRYMNLELRNKVIISLMIHQGIAGLELCRLKLEDVNLDEGTVHVKGSKKSIARTINLIPSQIMLIQKYIDTSRKNLLKSTTDFLIVTQRGVGETVDGIHSMIGQLKALYPDRVLSPSTIRQSVLSNLLNEKKMPLEQVQLFAGHKWPSSTEKYRRKNINEQRVLINMYHPLK